MWQTTTLTDLQRQPPDSYSAETSNKLEKLHLHLCQMCSSGAVKEWMEFFKEDGDISEEELKVLDGLLEKMDVSGDGRVSSDEIKALPNFYNLDGLHAQGPAQVNLAGDGSGDPGSMPVMAALKRMPGLGRSASGCKLVLSAFSAAHRRGVDRQQLRRFRASQSCRVGLGRAAVARSVAQDRLKSRANLGCFAAVLCPMSAEQIALMFDHLRDQVVLALKAKEEDASMIADLQQQLGAQTEKVKILEAQLQELRQVVLGLTQEEVEEEGEEESESTGTPPAPTPEELEEQTDSDAEHLATPSPSQIAKILLQQVFTRLAAKGETTEGVQKSQSDDVIMWAGPGVQVEEQQTTTQSADA
ncbi:unnamed protein product, partial [Symbiodinium microadriaticum]